MSATSAIPVVVYLQDRSRFQQGQYGGLTLQTTGYPISPIPISHQAIQGPHMYTEATVLLAIHIFFPYMYTPNRTLSSILNEKRALMVKILQSTERNGIAELELVRLWQKEARDINFWRNEAKTIKPFVEELKANTSRTLPKKAPSGKMRQEKAADLIKKNKKAMTSHTSAEGDKKTDNMEEGEILDTAKGRQTFPDITRGKAKSVMEEENLDPLQDRGE